LGNILDACGVLVQQLDDRVVPEFVSRVHDLIGGISQLQRGGFPDHFRSGRGFFGALFFQPMSAINAELAFFGDSLAAIAAKAYWLRFPAAV
jgi:hypothetical protein